MAKFKFAPTISGIIGTLGTGVYYRTNSSKFGILRSWVMPKPSISTSTRGSWISNLSKIWKGEAVQAGKDDFTTYGQKYKDLPVYGEDMKVRTASSFAIWYKAIYNWSVDLGTVDLSTITMDDFVLVADQIGTVKLCVENGYLPVVEGYEDLDHDWTLV